MNKSETNKIILEALREVPIEILFSTEDTNHCKRDQIKKNRFWFEFPERWANQGDKDAIIGIRDIYLCRRSAPLIFDLEISVVDTETQKSWYKASGRHRIWIGGNDTLNRFIEEFNLKWFDNMKIVESSDAEAYQNTWNNKLIECYYYYDEDKCKMFIGRPCAMPEIVEYKDSLGTTHYGNVHLTINNFNSDFTALFGEPPHEDGMGNKVWSDLYCIEFNCWSRHQLYITSSISSDDFNGFLGHSRAGSFTPLKYFRITSKTKRFWIDLYETRDHAAPVELPRDGRDVLTIEAIMCFSSTGML